MRIIITGYEHQEKEICVDGIKLILEMSNETWRMIPDKPSKGWRRHVRNIKSTNKKEK